MGVPEDDTQSRVPFRDNPAPSSKVSTQEMKRVTQETFRDYQEDEPESSGPGCFVWSIVGGLVVVVGLIVVLGAALAGWSSGQHEAQINATATRGAQNTIQCNLLEGEVTARNPELLQARMDSLLTQTPPVPCVFPYIPTATALYLTSLPTLTPTTAPPTLAPTSAPLTATVPAETTSEAASSGYDLGSLMDDARVSINLSQWDEAIRTLDAITAIDPNYETDTVQRMLFQALTSRARELYRAGDQLAEAILLTDRAEQVDPQAMADSDLNFERLVAGLWLDAQRNRGVNYPEAIRLYQQVIGYSPNYRNGEAALELFRQYVAYGDALVAGGDPCSAATQYQDALQLQADSSVSAKRDNANTACSSGQLTPSGSATPGMAPIGQPGT